MGQNGYQPLSYPELAAFSRDVICVHPSQMDLFFLTMEETDNGVLYDYYQKVNKVADDLGDGSGGRPRKPPRKRK